MKIEVRMYHVGFGDCFLVTLSETEEGRTFRMLFDCGRHSGSKPTDAGEMPFEDVVATLIDDVVDDAGEPRIDVIVVTHRHRDHVHGFRYADLWRRVHVGEVWLPWIEDPQNPFAAELKDRQERLAVRSFHALNALAMGVDDPGPEHEEAVQIAYNSTTNADAMRTLMDGGFANRPRLRFLPRLGREPDRLTGGEAVLPAGLTAWVLGPSRDPSVIKLLDPPSGATYHPLLPADPSLPSTESVPDGVPGMVPLPFPESWAVTEDDYRFDPGEADAVPGILRSALLEPLELVYRLDNAVNGTSLVVLLEVDGQRLLFPGDAQWGTWKMMLENPEIRPLLDDISFYKVGHHGSHNATPIEFVTDCLSPDSTVAMISVAPTNYRGGWQHIPLQQLVEQLGAHTREILRADDSDPDAGGVRAPHSAREIETGRGSTQR